MKLYISALGHINVQHLCSSSIYKPNISVSSLTDDSVQSRRGVQFLAWALYISALEHARTLKFSCYVLLVSINKIYKYYHALVI